MDDPDLYWLPLVELRNRLNFWVRVAWRDDDGLLEDGTWGTLFIYPVRSYIEGPDGPWPLRVIEWIDISTRNVSFSRVGPPQFADIKDELMAGLKETQVRWELLETTWSIDRFTFGFKDEPIQIVRVANPFGPNLKVV